MKKNICLWATMSTLLLAGTSPTHSAPFSVADLRCEDLADPLGIETITPRLSWKMAEKPRTKEWLKVCDPMQIPLPGAKGWTDMERVYLNP